MQDIFYEGVITFIFPREPKMLSISYVMFSALQDWLWRWHKYIKVNFRGRDPQTGAKKPDTEMIISDLQLSYGTCLTPWSSVGIGNRATATDMYVGT